MMNLLSLYGVGGCNGIIAFSVRGRDSNNTLDIDQLKSMHCRLATKGSDGVRVFLGQPVQLRKEDPALSSATCPPAAVLRIALGADMLLRMLESTAPSGEALPNLLTVSFEDHKALTAIASMARELRRDGATSMLSSSLRALADVRRASFHQVDSRLQLQLPGHPLADRADSTQIEKFSAAQRALAAAVSPVPKGELLYIILAIQVCLLIYGMNYYL